MNPSQASLMVTSSLNDVKCILPNNMEVCNTDKDVPSALDWINKITGLIVC